MLRRGKGEMMAVMVLEGEDRMVFGNGIFASDVSMAGWGEGYGSGKRHLLVGIPSCALMPFVISGRYLFSRCDVLKWYYRALLKGCCKD